MTDRLRDRLARGDWVVTVEVVTPAPGDATTRTRIATLADAVRDDARVTALTLTDRTASLDADPVAFAPFVIERAASAPLVHIAGKGRDARSAEDALERAAAAGIGSVLLTGGDAAPGTPLGLDSLDLLRLAKTRVPAMVPLAVTALPSSVRAPVSWDRTRAKRDAGAEAFVAQVSWDLGEREIVAEWQARLTAPIVGAAMLLTRGRLAFLAAHRIGGIVVPPELRARASAGGLDDARRRLALDLVLLRRLGYAGAHVSGVLTPALLDAVLTDAAHLDASLGDDWRGVWREAASIA